MKKKLLTVILSLLACVCLCIGISACDGSGSSGSITANGTYYSYEYGKVDKSVFFTLKNGEWEDDDGASGTYEMNGNKITLYTTIFGSKEELCSGSLTNGKLTLNVFGVDHVYYKEGSAPSNSSDNNNGGSQTPSAKEVKITYNANGGSFSDGGDTVTQTSKEGAKLTAPVSPTRSNYTFAGWARNRSGSTMWKFDEDTVTGDITLYAQWSQASATILSVEGASIDGKSILMIVDGTTDTVSLSDKVVCSEDSIWRLYSDPEGQREIPTKMVTKLKNGDNVYYLVVNSQNQAQVNVYKLTVHRICVVPIYYYDGEELLRMTEAITSKTFTADYIPQIEGYTFNGWKTVDGQDFTSDIIWSILILYADKTPNNYAAMLDVNGGDNLSPAERNVAYGSAFSLPVPSRTGYSFTGWYIGNKQITDERGSSLAVWCYTDSQNLTAHWKANKYSITLRSNDSKAGTVSGEGDFEYDSDVTIKANTNNGYTFLGWYRGNDKVSSDLSYKFKMGLAATYTAKWIKCPVTVRSSDENAGSVSGLPSTTVIGQEIILTATTNKGYTFVGWYKGEEQVCKDLTYQYTMTQENVTLEARWEITHYTLTFVYDSNVGDAENIPKDYTIKDLPLMLPKLIGKNDNKHISVGWTTEDGTEYTNEIPKGTTGELTLTVIWGVTEGTHSWEDDNACSVCGAKKLYTMSEDGTKIYFGEYPQTEVKESGLKGFLGMEAGATPTSSNAGKWKDYGYYISGSVQSYMWYIDVEYQGSRYRGVYFTSYRPYYTMYSSSTGNSYQDDNGYKTNTVYWFKYEPIEWRILEQKDGTALLMANIILDSQQYYRTTSGTRTVNGKTVYPNNYKESDIRAWLTETFYETAFDELAQQIIETTTVDNSASTTSSSSNSYACENTQDKVFLLSWKEILNTSYGFSSSYSTHDTARRLKSTDYAKSQGCWQSTDSSYRGNGWWWLRSPYNYSSYDAYYVYRDGDAYYDHNVRYTYGGVVPALRIRL